MPAHPNPEATPPKMLSEVVQDKLRAGHYSRRTEEAYLGWIRRFIKFHHGHHPRELREPEVVAFLEDLARAGNVSASTQKRVSPESYLSPLLRFSSFSNAAWQTIKGKKSKISTFLAIFPPFSCQEIVL